MRLVQIMAFAPLHAPEITRVPGDLATMQSIVGGLVEVFDIEVDGDLYQVIVNEDAEPLRLPKNRVVGGRTLYGTFVVTKFDFERFTSITNKEAMRIWKHLDQQA